MHYDVIGDIHGQADKLLALLHKLGYRERAGVWGQAGRTAVFVGDFIDRGPAQLRTLDIVRAMVDDGRALAVMGNHEFNAITWVLHDPDAPGEHLRPRQGPRGARNRHQHRAFLAEVEDDVSRHRDIVEWFLTLPLWLDLPELRVVHACWHAPSIADLAPRLEPGNRLDKEMVVRASRAGSLECNALETLTRGLDVALPQGHVFLCKDGIERSKVRVRWWDLDALTYRQAALLDPIERKHLPHAEIPRSALLGYPDKKPVFFGHYWFTGTPAPLCPHVACVDYGAGGGNPLVAYRWDGEPELRADHFVKSAD